MTKEQRDRANSRSGNSSAGKSEQDLAAKAVLDNMARLKALRLARDAAEPPRPAPAKIKRKQATSKKTEEKAPALSDWLASQQGGGRRF
jgi:hypothetical protein